MPTTLCLFPMYFGSLPYTVPLKRTLVPWAITRCCALQEFALQPEEGDLLVFPGWLVHRVEEGEQAEERISFSFNIPGSWHTVSDLRSGEVV